MFPFTSVTVKVIELVPKSVQLNDVLEMAIVETPQLSVLLLLTWVAVKVPVPLAFK